MTQLRLSSSLAALLFPFILHGAELPPRIAGDFASGKPVLDIAPGEKRLSRSTLPGDRYGKHPYSGFAGKRFSLKETVEAEPTGGHRLVLKTPLSTRAHRALNARSGTLAAWWQPGSEPGPLLTARNAYMESYPGNAVWELGVAEGGRLFLKTAAAKCETAEPPPPGWVHVVAVWDADHGARLYLNGKPVAGAWAEPVPAEEAEPIFDSRHEPRFFFRSVFSRGTGQRAMVPLERTAEWKEDRIALEEGGLSVAKEGSERLQMRTQGFARLAPGRYELAVEMQASEGARWKPRLTIRGSGEPRYASLVPTGGRFAFEVRPEDADTELVLDLNFETPGTFEVGSVALYPARPEGAVLAPVPLPLPSDRLVIHPRPEGALKGLRVYDQPLSAEGVQALFEGSAPDAAQVEPPGIHTEARLATLGWAEPAPVELPVAQAGQTLRFRQAPVLEALENRRAAGWLAVSGFPNESFPWSYHGYRQGVPQQLRLTLDAAPNWMTGTAHAFRGTLGQTPFAADGAFFQRPLEGVGTELSFTCEEGTLSRLEFYRVGTERALPKEGQPLRKGEADLAEYPAADRLTFTPYARESRAKERITLPALATWHLSSVPQEKETALGGVSLLLRMAPISEPTRARLVIHDPSTPGRELARLEFVLAPSDKGEYGLQVDLRETLLPPGTTLRASLVLEREAGLLIGNHGSGLALTPAADADRAARLWRDWEVRSVRDRIERISEPRPWGEIGAEPESRWWLKAASPVYDQIDNALERLRARFPKDPTVRAWYAFTHPQAPVKLEEIDLPKTGKHPEWAVLTLECLRQYRAFLDFWVDQRQMPHGELGHFYGDDTDLVQDWLDMTLISDPKGKYAGSLGLLAHGIAETFTATGGRDGPSGGRIAGRPLIKKGLNLRWTDVLHAYEDGLNVQPPDFVAHYGDPVRFQRLLDTASRYDGFILTPEKEGQRRFASVGKGTAFVNSDYLSGSPDDKYWPLMLHAGLTAAWYNDDPALWKLLEEVARGELAGPRPLRSAAAALMQGVFRKTGDVKYLEPLMDAALWNQEHAVRMEGLYASNLLRLPGLNREATLRELRADAAERYANHGSERLGWGDDRHLRNWLEWRLSGEEEPLLVGLRALYRQWALLMPAYTEAEQSGDRVSPPKQLISQLYLGGVPGSRNRHFYPDFAVSYQGLDDTFAARVEEATPRKLRVRLYSFADAPAEGTLRVWALEPGRYRVTSGEEEEGREFELRRGEGFPITLPSQEEVTFTVSQIERSAEPALLPDPALSVESVRHDGGALAITVWNLGVAPLEAGGTVVLHDAEGKVLAEKPLPALPGVKDWKAGQTVVLFENPPAKATRVGVAPAQGVPEITPCNNHTPIPPPPTLPSAG